MVFEAHGMSFPCTELLLFNYAKGKDSFPFYGTFNNAPNVLNSEDLDCSRPIQHPDSSTTKPCCCNSCSMWFCIVLLRTCKLPTRMHLCNPHTNQSYWLLNWMLITRWKGLSPLISPEDTASVISNKNVNLDLSDHRTLFHFETVHLLKWALATGHGSVLTMFTYGFLFAW